MKVKASVSAAAALFLGAVAVVIVLAVGSSPAPITAHGQLQISGENALSASQGFPDITDGTQVVVVNPSGTVIGTGTLSYDQAASNDSVVGIGQMEDWVTYDFSVTVPGGEPRYGVRITTHGTVWFTQAQLKKGPALSLAGTGGE
jgi:hypothetical protein